MIHGEQCNFGPRRALSPHPSRHEGALFRGAESYSYHLKGGDLC